MFSGTEKDKEAGVDVPFTASVADYMAPSGIGKKEKAFLETNYGVSIYDDRALLTKKSKTPNYLRDATDGLSNSLMYTECSGKPDIWLGGQKTDDMNFKSSWASHSTGFDPKMITPGSPKEMGPCCINCTNDKGVYSFHPGGAAAGFGDGSVRFLNKEISPPVFASILTRANGEIVVELD